ncbi:MAG: type IV secretion system DNA-binding domain-containing protein [Clostridia bacterium]|nr:type IV secretion system DNA-binding domain-containing protein [Clostridia bacterium]
MELHKIISYPDYYKEKIELLRKRFLNKQFSNLDMKTLSTCIDFFENEFFNLDNRVLSILKSEISRITNLFVSDSEISDIFCSSESELTFLSFKDVLKNGKIVVLDMNISEYSGLSKVIAAYLKLDFQAEILSQLSYLSSNEIRTSCFLCDEYHEYVTLNDAGFFSQSREAKCINIVATQSYTSLLNSINNPNSTKVIIQSLINKFWFRTDDSFTIDEIQKQLGKEEKRRSSITISENAKSTNYNFLTNSFVSQDSNLSESINTYNQKDFLYDSNFFTQTLKTFSCLGFISNGSEILKPSQIFLTPYFKNLPTVTNIYSNTKGFDLNENNL